MINKNENLSYLRGIRRRHLKDVTSPQFEENQKQSGFFSRFRRRHLEIAHPHFEEIQKETGGSF